MTNKNYLTGHRNAKLLQIKCPEQLPPPLLTKMTIGHRCLCSWCRCWNIHLLFLCPVNIKKEGCRMEWLFYNNSSPSCLHCFIFRNTLHLVLVPYLFKIDASLKNSLSLQCTSLYFLTFDSVCELSLTTSGFKLLPVRGRSGRGRLNDPQHYILSTINNTWTTKPPEKTKRTLIMKQKGIMWCPKVVKGDWNNDMHIRDPSDPGLVSAQQRKQTDPPPPKTCSPTGQTGSRTI